MGFDEAFDRLISHEGGYLSPEDAAKQGDPGGETHWGISRRSYPDVDIAGLTRDGAKAIYFRDFWTPLTAASVNPAVLFQLFDYAVNSGISNALRAFQSAVGVAPDGHVGPVTIAAAKLVEIHDMLMLVLAARLEFMTGLSNWPSAGRGWARRIAGNLRYAAADTPD